MKPKGLPEYPPPLSDRCTYFYNGRQCEAPREKGSTRCAFHDGGRRHAKASA